MAYATIAGIGHYVPAECLTNAELERRLGESIADWLVANVGGGVALAAALVRWTL